MRFSTWRVTYALGAARATYDPADDRYAIVVRVKHNDLGADSHGAPCKFTCTIEWGRHCMCVPIDERNMCPESKDFLEWVNYPNRTVYDVAAFCSAAGLLFLARLNSDRIQNERLHALIIVLAAVRWQVGQHRFECTPWGGSSGYGPCLVFEPYIPVARALGAKEEVETVVDAQLAPATKE